MNRTLRLFFLIIFLLSGNLLFSEGYYCKNLGFEMGNFTNWTGYTWIYSTDVPSINTSKVAGIVYRRQTIMKDTTAYDAKTGNQLRIIPSGYKYCARLGDVTTNSDANPRCWNQSLRYSMTVDSTNSLLIMKFACVLQYASDHTAKMEPRFRLTLFDEKGDTIHDCANYDVFSSSTTIDGFKSYTPAGDNSPVQWRDWTTVGANLLPYMGKTITIEFMASDCTGRYHYGYAYFLAQCHPMSIAVKYCAGDTKAVLTAPEGFKTYNWTDSSGKTVASSQILSIDNPAEGSVYSCTMTSATGCTVTLNSTIIRYEITSDFSSYMLDCASNKVQFTNHTTTTHGTLTYKWDFGDSITSTAKNPQYMFKTSGMHTVGLIITNPPSECTKTLIKEVESFSPPLVGIHGNSTYCPNESVTLKAFGAYKYLWNTGSTADSATVSAPGGKYWMIGHSSTGCVSDTAFIFISEEPNWKFIVDGLTGICKNSTSVLTAVGAKSYLWSTGDTTRAIAVTKAGDYKVTGVNARGCQKVLTMNVVVYPLPNAVFSVSSETIDARHNQLTCSIESASGVQYIWSLGDGSSETGSTVLHTYNQVNSVSDYIVSLTATDSHNCIDSTSQTIDVIPFIPNVFTPNGDGINDLFMKGIETEVFDRNGLKLYKGKEGWDGTYNGRALSPDTYFYLIRYSDKNGNEQKVKGFITLNR